MDRIGKIADYQRYGHVAPGRDLSITPPYAIRCKADELLEFDSVKLSPIWRISPALRAMLSQVK